MSDHHPDPLPPSGITLSIVVPCYNGRATIVETVRSALAQREIASEVIVVDDGSSDDSLEVLSRAGLLDATRWIRQENQGVAAARNRGLSLATGEYVCFLDHDDLLDPRFAREMVGMLRERGLRIGYSDYRYFADVPGYPDVNIRYPTYEGWVLGNIVSENFIPTTGVVLMERSVLADAKFDTNRLGTDDWGMWIALLARYPIGHCPKRLVSIRLLAHSLGHRKRAMIEDTIGLLRWAEPMVAAAGAALTGRERARYYYRYASVLLDGGYRKEALERWRQATRHGLEARYHRNFVGKLVLGLLGARQLVERALWNRRMRPTAGALLSAQPGENRSRTRDSSG